MTSVLQQATCEMTVADLLLTRQEMIVVGLVRPNAATTAYEDLGPLTVPLLAQLKPNLLRNEVILGK